MRTKNRLGAIALGIAATLGALAGNVLAQDPLGPQALDCHEGDLVYSLTNELLPTDAPGGPASSAQALAAFADRAYPGMRDAVEVKQSAQGNDSDSDGSPESTFTLDTDQDGVPSAIATVERTGDSWTFLQLTACNSLLVEYAEGGQW